MSADSFLIFFFFTFIPEGKGFLAAELGRNLGVGVFFFYYAAVLMLGTIQCFCFFLWLNASYSSQRASVHLLPVASLLSLSLSFSPPPLYSLEGASECWALPLSHLVFPSTVT